MARAQINVPVQPGNSDDAPVDERGNVIGIVSAKLDASAALAAERTKLLEQESAELQQQAERLAGEIKELSGEAASPIS